MYLLVYPETPAPQYLISYEEEYKTLTTSFEGGTEQRRQQWMLPKRRTGLKYDILEAIEINTLWNFYKSCRGPAISFWFFEPDVLPYNTHEDEYVGRGDGSKVISPLLPYKWRMKLFETERYGMFLVMLFIFFAFPAILPIINFFFSLITGL